MFFNEIILLIPAGEILSALFHQHRKFRGQGQWQSSDPPPPSPSPADTDSRSRLRAFQQGKNACQHGHHVRVVQWNYSRPEPEVSSSQSGTLRMTRGRPAEVKLVEVHAAFAAVCCLKFVRQAAATFWGQRICGRSSIGATTPASSRVTTSNHRSQNKLVKNWKHKA